MAVSSAWSSSHREAALSDTPVPVPGGVEIFRGLREGVRMAALAQLAADERTGMRTAPVDAELAVQPGLEPVPVAVEPFQQSLLLRATRMVSISSAYR